MAELQLLEETVLENYKSHDFAKGLSSDFFLMVRTSGEFNDPIRY